MSISANPRIIAADGVDKCDIVIGDGEPGRPLNENEKARGAEDFWLVLLVEAGVALLVSSRRPPRCGGVERVGERNICGGKLAALAGPAPHNEQVW